MGVRQLERARLRCSKPQIIANPSCFILRVSVILHPWSPTPARRAASRRAFAGSNVHCLSPALRAGSAHVLRFPGSPFILHAHGHARMNIRGQVLVWTAQRVSAAVLAVCVLVHLITIIYAVRNGLSAAEILGRTRGNVAWAGFYALFVVAVAVHAPIGLRNVLSESFNWRGRGLEVTVLAIGLLLGVWGLRAVYAVFV